MASSAKTPPHVSVIIPAYNAVGTLPRTLKSLMDQTFEDWEALVVNDCSRDNTAEMVETYTRLDGRIKLINQPKNGGPSEARNAGLEAARGEWVALLDADDAYAPERLITLLDYAQKGGLDMVADNQLFWDAEAQTVSRKAMALKAPAAWTLESHLQKEKLGSTFKWGLFKPLIRRAFIEEHGIRYRSQFRMGEDSLFYMELLAHSAKAMAVPEAMYVYTTSRGELSRRVSAASHSRYVLEEHVATYHYFREHYAGMVSAAALRALERCEDAAVDSDQAQRFKQDLRGKKPVAALGRLMKRPALAGFLWLGLWKFVVYRVILRLRRRLFYRS